MKRKKPAQPGLFDAELFPLFIAEQADDTPCMQAPRIDATTWMEQPDLDYSLNWGLSGQANRCTLDGKSARIIGGPSARYATIEPLDIDAEPIRCCWDVVADVLENGDGAFVRDDDDTDE